MKREVIAALCDVRSVYNVASMFRTADGAGIAKIYCCGITPMPFDRLEKPRKDFVKVSLGAERFVEWKHAVSATRLLQKLKKEGYIVIALEQDARAVPYTACRDLRAHKIAFCIGSETLGLSRAVRNISDHIFEIPMRGTKESLNVSVAFGIFAYALCRE